ncbi:MAG: FKBP-type peptidyl-prolyl cis-trans isomerase [Bacteroidales bacterium]|nr:FKBP-type peptidyl-prolyl cis-trans isomerase [Bacteroidales bacterium]MDD4641277.1 FKBP-type peptidyl-prolyl cis-trans isomerase [Bacteroidales bacterium]
MKPAFLYLFLLGSILSITSCLDDPEAIAWRKANDDFMQSLKASSEYKPLEINDHILYGDESYNYLEHPLSGIYYKTLEQGQGALPLVGQTVEVEYEGRLYDNTIFDSGSRTTLVGSGVIEGWSEVLYRIPQGSSWEVVIPYYLGYGETKYGSIPGYSCLIFRMELVRILED